MSPWVLDWVREAMGVAVLLAVPFVGAALAGCVVAGLLAWLLGLQDPVVSTIARTVTVVVALVLLAGTIGEQLRTYVHDAWSELPRLGRAE